MELTWAHTEKCRQHRPASTTVDIARPQRNRTTQEHLENGSQEWNVDGGLQVLLQEDKGGSSQ